MPAYLSGSIDQELLGCISELRQRVGGRRRGAFHAPAGGWKPPLEFGPTPTVPKSCVVVVTQR